MTKTQLKALQRVLAGAGLYGGEIDGLMGDLTRGGVEALLDRRAEDASEDPANWSTKRRQIACLQLGCLDAGLDVGPIDGLWGPRTDSAVELLLEQQATGRPPRLWRDEEPLDVNPHAWPREAGLEARFGLPCEVPLTRVRCPWPLKLAWRPATRLTEFSCHEAIADSLANVLERVHAHYGDAEIRRLGLDLFGGCYNCRKKRGGSSWSTHAWGIAIDWDPGHNKLTWGRDRAHLARADYLDWWRFWEEDGWLSLGRTCNFDWMHVQAAKL
jgi:hypothetical protein